MLRILFSMPKEDLQSKRFPKHFSFFRLQTFEKPNSIESRKASMLGRKRSFYFFKTPLPIPFYPTFPFLRKGIENCFLWLSVLHLILDRNTLIYFWRL